MEQPIIRYLLCQKDVYKVRPDQSPANGEYIDIDENRIYEAIAKGYVKVQSYRIYLKTTMNEEDFLHILDSLVDNEYRFSPITSIEFDIQAMQTKEELKQAYCKLYYINSAIQKEMFLFKVANTHVAV